MAVSEQLSNLVQTTLNGAINASTTTLVLASATGFPSSGNFRLRCKSSGEIMLCTARSGTTCTVTRGAESTTAATHPDGEPIALILTAGAIAAAISDAGSAEVPTTRTLAAGNGLSGGGDLSADRSFALVMADATHDGGVSQTAQIFAGAKTFNGGLLSGGNITPIADNTQNVGTSALRFAAVAAVVFNVFAVASDANASLALSSNSIKLGPGGATAADVSLTRSAASVLTLADAAGTGSATLRSPATLTVNAVTKTQIQANDTTVASFGNASSDFIALAGAGAPAATGAVRLANNVYVKAMNGAGDTDINILALGTSNSLNFGAVGSSGPANLAFSTNGINAFYSSSLIFGDTSGGGTTVFNVALVNNGTSSFLAAATVTLFKIGFADKTTNSGTGANLTLAAQNETGTSSTGGDINLNPGTGTSANGFVNFVNQAVASSATNGAIALPTLLAGYLPIKVGGTIYKVLLAAN